ncbi:hypothetical protein [Bradyrhizobium sp. dw_78]|uniref:hypothetical protein n=1 Tax=Bradyrhizobium sp. dw_78 TaxID=2719793 RepID=UPI001BD61F90|nr:hypothetical protein [Bradyrhizobium sp. dw_78]
MISFALFASGCTVVPALDQATGSSDSDIFVGDVVNRIKCELVYAFGDKLVFDRKRQLELPPDDVRRKLLWLSDWTIKADLTLEANEQGGIAPSGSYTVTQRSAVNAAAGPTSVPGTTLGTVAQFFTLSANANAGAQAVRAEVISISFSLKELSEWSRSLGNSLPDRCAIEQQMGLVGHLGLREWIDATLYPVINGDLHAGQHPAPGAVAKPSLPATIAKPSPLPTGSNDAVSLSPQTNLPPLSPDQLIVTNKMLASIQSDVNDTSDAEKLAASSLAATMSSLAAVEKALAQLNETKNRFQSVATKETNQQFSATRDALLNSISSLRDVRDKALKDLCGAKATFEEFTKNGKKCVLHQDEEEGAETALTIINATQAAADSAKQKNDLTALTKLFDQAEGVKRSAIQFSKRAEGEADYAQKLAAAAPTASSPNPPFDSIGHTVEFVVAYGGGISPSWTLLQWKGPGLGGTLASVTVNRTHLLQLALGEPSQPSEQSRIINNQAILLGRQ